MLADKIIGLYFLGCFYLYISDHIQELHSFPTRRSSDLISRRGRQRLGRVGAVAVAAAKVRVDPDDGRLARRQRDRKSTRLNSSHPSISYAVFCLKKKKI